MGHVLAIDSSTQGTKGTLFDGAGRLVARADRAHRQIIDDHGWIEHDPDELWTNFLGAADDVIARAAIDPADIVALGISNQRETSLMWDRGSGRPIANAIVWQCSRARELCERPALLAAAEEVRRRSGLELSPYFPAAKLAWLMENVPAARTLADEGRLACGTVDSWLLFNLVGRLMTDYSNASRTQLFNIAELAWDPELCALFGIPIESLPTVAMSDATYGMTDLGGLLPRPIPVCGVLGDSHAALFAQDCRRPGQIKATYGTGSSVMMNIGPELRLSEGGLVTSIAWGMNGCVDYVFEGNLNYTGAVIAWLKNDVGLIATDQEATDLAFSANPADRTYFVPAFSGLDAPYWESDATGLLTGITRTTGRAEIAKACLESIAYQIADLTQLAAGESGLGLAELRVDGGPTASSYLMRFQSDIADMRIRVPELQELSAMGAAYAAGIAVGLYDPETIYDHVRHEIYAPTMDAAERTARLAGWKRAIAQVLSATR